MARKINRLTAVGAKALTEPGMHADGAGLYLRIDQTGNRRWVLVFFHGGKRREMGLGAAATVELKAARLAAGAARRLVAAGRDPIAERKLDAASALTFGEMAEQVITDLEPGWKSDKAGAQWRSSIKQHASHLAEMPIAAVDEIAVLKVLKPIWQTIPETATRVRARIERILDIARIRGLRTGENPARWKGHLQLLMAKQVRVRGHHKALAYERLPDFIQKLRDRPAMAARALEFTILAATRTTETREAKWSEIDGDVWTIPAERMKAKREHRVPLTPRMIEILDEVRPLKSSADLIFPGDQRIEPLSQMAMAMLLRRMEVSVTVHGFRSAFRDWAGDCTLYPREVVEEALAHTVGSSTERAYRRRDALAKRRELMTAWASYCGTPTGANVVKFVRA